MSDLGRLRPLSNSLSNVELAVKNGEFDGIVDGLSEKEKEKLLYDWSQWSRPNQRMPQSMGSRYRIWMIRAGRGYGKTRTGAEACRVMAQKVSRIALVAPIGADIRDVMVEGESGIMAVCPPDERPTRHYGRRNIEFPSGCRAFFYSAEEPDRLRGPQHEWGWIDEPASMRRGPDILSNMMLGLRLGRNPWAMLTGTPKPVKWLRDLADRKDTFVTSGSTFENIGNLAPSFIEDIVERYEGTRLGRQELHAEWLDDVEGALWSEEIIDQYRIAGWNRDDPWRSLNDWLGKGGEPARVDRRPWRTVVAVDPPGYTAECGIVTASAPVRPRLGYDHAVVLSDDSTAGTPERWGQAVISAWRNSNASEVWVEGNQGGDMARAVIHAVDSTCPVRMLTARRSKSARAEPIAAMYEKGWIHHVGFLPMLESQMVTWVPSEGKSPDRVDAMVHAMRVLFPDSARSNPITVKSPV